MADEKFYLQDETHYNVPTKKDVVLKDLLYFTSTVRNISGVKMEPNVYADKATKQHIKDYPQAFSDFMAANPGFILPWDRVEGGPSFAVVVKEEDPAPVTRRSGYAKRSED